MVLLINRMMGAFNLSPSTRIKLGEEHRGLKSRVNDGQVDPLCDVKSLPEYFPTADDESLCLSPTPTL